MNLYAHQEQGVKFLASRGAAMLCDEQGTGKTRQALVAAQQLFAAKKIDRVLVLAPAAVAISWREELNKVGPEPFIHCVYDSKLQAIYGARIQRAEKREPWQAATNSDLPVLLVSYSLLPQKRHIEALKRWCEDGKAKTLLIADESSFLKNRTAKQTKGAAQISRVCLFRWLLTGTPIANSPLDLYAQSIVMSDGTGPLCQFKSFYHFRSRYAVLKPMRMGQVRFQQIVAYQNLPELTKRFAPYVLRREKKDCLDLPAKSYTVREIALSDATWRIYQELRRDALLALPDSDVRPEPNAAVRLLRLCQLTSGHVGSLVAESEEGLETFAGLIRDVSREKLDWLCDAILGGELSNERAMIIWCRWRRERERLQQMLAGKIEVYRVFGGQQEKNRSTDIQAFQTSQNRRVLVAQPHAGGFGLNLTAASTVIYLSNDFSYTTRVQSEDRVHRIGQHNPCTYIDVIATGPKGQRTVDHHVLEALRAKQDIAQMTCAGWRKVLEEE